MPTVKQERRSTRRIPLALPVSLGGAKGARRGADAETRDVSARGVFFHLDSRLEKGARIEFTLVLPADVTMTESVRVRCQGRVLRVHPGGRGHKAGIAAVIDHYDFVAEG